MALPDLLADNLKLVICSVDADYAAAGNRLWETLHDIGLTPRTLEPSEWQSLLEFGIGLVELEPDTAGVGVRFEGGKELRRKLREYAPRTLVFNGKKAAKEYFKMPTTVYGLLPNTIGTTKLFVCPSTSAAAKSSWDPRWWQVMAKLA